MPGIGVLISKLVLCDVEIAVEIGGFVLEEKSSFKMLGLTFSSKLDWGAYIISIAETASKKIRALIRFMKVFLLRLLCISINLPYAYAYCCHVKVGAPSCYLELLDKLEKGYACRTVGPSLAISREPLAHRRNVERNFPIGINLVDVHLKRLSWFHVFISEGGLLVFLTDLMVFLSLFLARMLRGCLCPQFLSSHN